jgi:hypothetical protein
MKRLLSTAAAFMMMVAVAGATTNEINVQIVFKATKDAASVLRQPGTVEAQWAGTKYYTRVYDADTTNAPLENGSITSPGWAYFRNISTQGTINITIGTLTNVFTLLAEEPAVIRLHESFSITNIKYAAESGSVQLEATIIEK